MIKRLISIILMVCMILTLFPTVAMAAAQTLTASDEAGLSTAAANAASGDTIVIDGDFSIASSIIISKNVTLDLAGHALTYTGPTGAVCLRFTAGGMIADSAGGGAFTAGVDNISLIHNAGGTLEIAGGTLTVENSSQSRAVQNDGTLRVTGGKLNSASGYGVLNNGAVVVTDGEIATVNGRGVLNYTADSTLTVSGGVVKTTSQTEEQTYAAYNNIAGATITVNSGTVSAGSGDAVANYNGGTIVINGGTVSSETGMAVFNQGDSVAAIHSGTVESVSGYGVLNYGNLTIDGGAVSSEDSVALASFAKGGKDIRLSGGTVTAKAAAAVYNNGSGEIQLLGSTVTTTAPDYPAVVNGAAGTVSVTDGTITAAGNNPVFYNVSSGTIAITGGTYSGVYNASATGSVKIDGGSVKLVQGTTAQNSAGTALQPYILKLTNNGAPITNTPVSGSELTFTPADKASGYGFSGVRTDADGRLYLWLPAGINNALYKSQTVEITGAVAGGTESLLPNFNVAVTVYLDGQIWADCPSDFEPTLEVEGSGIRRAIMHTGRSGGVFTYSGLDRNNVYEVWGYSYAGVKFTGVKLSKDSPSVELHYYTLTLNNGGGISLIYPYSGSYIYQGMDVSVAAFPQSGLTFEKWVDTEGRTVSTQSQFSIGKMNGPLTYTATAKATPFDASVTVRKNGTAWTDFNGAVVLSSSAENTDTTLNGTVANGVYGFSGLNQTYYVWAKLSGGQLAYTGQKVTFGATSTAVDYYTVSLAKGSNISQVTGAGTYLKGSNVQVSAEVASGSSGLTYMFSRWTEGGALLSASNPYVVPSISRSYDLTAEGKISSFSATVTLNKDSALWNSGARTIHLTQQGSDAPIAGAVSNGVYTFTGLDSSKTYEIWDDETVRKTGISLDSSNRDRTLNYFTVAVSKGSGVISVAGGGVYLAGSTVAATAEAEAYHTVAWQATGTAGTADGAAYTVSNLNAATALSATGSLVNFTGKVTLKKDDAAWSGQTVRLSTDSAITGTIGPAQSADGNYSFSGLDPHDTYYIFVNGKTTGKTLIHTAVNVSLDYYTIEAALANATFEAKVGTAADSGPYLKGTTVSLTAALTNSNYDFIGWYNGSTLLTTEKELIVSGIAAKQTLSAVASSSFDAAVTVNGKLDLSGIKLSESSSALTNEMSVTPAGNKFTFEDLERGTTYYIFDGGAYTGKSVSKTVPAVTLQYYTITVSTSTGISAATANGNAAATVLEGTAVTLAATAVNDYVFSKWVDAGGSTVAQANPAIVTAGKDMAFTALSIGNYTGGEIDITTGWIEITDGSTAGTLKILKGGDLLGDNINPSQSITVKGNGTATGNRILISSTLAGAPSGSAVQLTLKDVKINLSANPAMEISSAAGDVDLTISGANSLETTQYYSGGIKKTGANKLTIRSIDGTTNHSLAALGNNQRGSGIGAAQARVQNIAIDSGLVMAFGWGAGIGSYHETESFTDNITINGGIAQGRNANESCIVGSKDNPFGYLENVTINGGVARLKLGGRTPNAAVRINGGNILHDSGSYQIAKNAAGESVYKTTFTVPGDTVGGLDVSKTLVIKDKNGKSYGMNDVVTFPEGKVYAYLPAGSATAAYDGKTYQTTVKADGTAVFAQLYTLNTPASKTVNGVTATAAAPVWTGTGYSVTVTLSGTALKPGDITMGLSGANGTTATQTKPVASGAVAGVTMTFVYPAPADDATDLALAMTFTEKSSFTVTYTAPNATSGSVPLDANRYYEKNSYTVAEAGTLQRTGYVFDGWKLGTDTHGASSVQTMGTANVAYTAVWSPNNYTVTFDKNDASAAGTMADQTFTYDAAAVSLSSNAFTRTGYTFAGWATSATGSKAYTQGEAVRNLTAVDNGTVRLYVLWKANTYTVTFEGNGATSGSTENQTVAHNTSTPLNPNGFVREGYIFAGWKAADGTPYANGASITAVGNVTLTAQWTANPYTVAFNGNGSTFGAMSEIDLLYGTAANLPANGFSRTGYTFAGWNTAAGGSGTAYADQAQAIGLTTIYNGTVQLYAQWTANTYTVQFNRNNGDTGTMTAQSFTYDAADTALSVNQFLRSGYVFAGWNTVADGSGTAYADQAAVRNLTATPGGVIPLYAQWNPGSFSVNFDPNGGIGIMTAQSFRTGDAAALKTNSFSRSGYTLTGWNTEAGGGGTAYGAQDAVNTLNMGGHNSITLYAQWSPNSYTVKFNANGATGTMAQQSFTYDAPATALTQNAFTRIGYTFLGWAGSPAGTSGEYADKQAVQNLTPLPGGTVTLYAAWKANTVAVAFEGNGATIGSMENQVFTHNTAQQLSLNTYQREGFTFAGWNTQSNGRGVSYIDGQELTDPTPDVTGNMTLYAQWQQQSRYGLSGLVTTDETPAVPVPDANVTLKQGNHVFGITKTDANGRYSFTNLLPGIYNVVCTEDGRTVTKAETIIESPIVVDFILSSTAKNSLLELRNEADVTIPALVVNGLNTVADEQAQPSGVTTVMLIVTAKAPSDLSGEQAAIRELANSHTVGMYLDAQLTSNGASIGSSNNTVLEILIPYDFSRKTNIRVLRYHDGAAAALTKLNSRPTSSFEDGTWFADVSAGRIFVYASKFSTYAVSYTPVSSGGGSGGSGGGSGALSGYPVVIDKSSAAHGTLTADRASAPAGAEVTVIARPNDGYQLHHLIITDENGKAIIYHEKSEGTYSFEMPKSKVSVSAEFSASLPSEPLKADFPFVDVPENHWAYADIAWAYENGIINGTGDGTTFSPSLPTTRGMIVTLLWRLEGKPAASGDCPFDDVGTGSYYEQAIVWAAGNEIVKGYGNALYGPDDTITREQMAAILCRYASDKGCDVSKERVLDQFTDGGNTSGYAVKAMGWAVANGLLSGKGDGILDPRACATRAEVAAILERFDDLFRVNSK